jgi:hypothetical protein
MKYIKSFEQSGDLKQIAEYLLIELSGRLDPTLKNLLKSIILYVDGQDVDIDELKQTSKYLLVELSGKLDPTLKNFLNSVTNL